MGVGRRLESPASSSVLRYNAAMQAVRDWSWSTHERSPYFISSQIGSVCRASRILGHSEIGPRCGEQLGA